LVLASPTGRLLLLARPDPFSMTTRSSIPASRTAQLESVGGVLNPSSLQLSSVFNSSILYVVHNTVQYLQVLYLLGHLPSCRYLSLPLPASPSPLLRPRACVSHLIASPITAKRPRSPSFCFGQASRLTRRQRTITSTPYAYAYAHRTRTPHVKATQHSSQL
jgi:hypothetical protein